MWLINLRGAFEWQWLFQKMAQPIFTSKAAPVFATPPSTPLDQRQLLAWISPANTCRTETYLTEPFLRRAFASKKKGRIVSDVSYFFLAATKYLAVIGTAKTAKDLPWSANSFSLKAPNMDGEPLTLD